MATKIDHRFLFDSFFFEEVLKNDSVLQQKLTYITSKAQSNKKKQNLISEKSRNKILKNNPKISLEVVRYFLNGIEPVEVIEVEDDEIARTLRYAVHHTYFYPNKVMIFTGKDKVGEYKNSQHYQNIKAISFVSKEDAVALINFWFDKCRDERVTSCE